MMMQNIAVENRTMMTANADHEEFEDSFHSTRQFLLQIRDLARKITLLKNRIAYREGAGLNSEEYGVVSVERLHSELADAERALKVATIRVTDLIGELKDGTQQAVMTKRYVDGKSWDAIALQMDIGVRAVQRAHGKALWTLDRILAAERN